jgi:hypothetical protein
MGELAGPVVSRRSIIFYEFRNKCRPNRGMFANKQRPSEERADGLAVSAFFGDEGRAMT